MVEGRLRPPGRWPGPHGRSGLPKQLLSRIWHGELEHEKQKGVYVGLPRRGKGIDLAGRLNAPRHVGRARVERQITIVNDCLERNVPVRSLAAGVTVTSTPRPLRRCSSLATWTCLSRSKCRGPRSRYLDAVLDHVVRGGKHGCGDGEDRLVRAPPRLEPEVLRAVIGVVLVGGGSSGLYEHSLQPRCSAADTSVSVTLLVSRLLTFIVSEDGVHVIVGPSTGSCVGPGAERRPRSGRRVADDTTRWRARSPGSRRASQKPRQTLCL